MFKVINRNVFLRYLINLVSRIEHHQRTLNRKCFTKSSRATNAIVLFIPLMEVDQDFNGSATLRIGSCDLHLKEISTYNYNFQESNRRENIN